MSHVCFSRTATFSSHLVKRALFLPTKRVQALKFKESRNSIVVFQRRCFFRHYGFTKDNLRDTLLSPLRHTSLLLRNVQTKLKSKSTITPEQLAQNQFKRRNRTVAIYVIAVTVFVLGGSYAAVPLYRLYCQASGLGGTVKKVEADKLQKMERVPERMLTVRFNSDTSAAMQWSFKPQQSEIKLAPGETALAFYTAKNPTDVAITGISTYNVIPFEVGQYFNKIQCFCFEEQRLNPQEEVDMPVFFFIDPEFTEDPAMAKIDSITLSYTFFEAKEADKLGIESVPH